jgi:glycosyltransferase involved in cell wall biosynthesis/peptidoglycan/xylan/chitin deacetylase (PgdA/CDA1 family)
MLDLRRRMRTVAKELASAAIRAAGLGVVARLTWSRRGVGIILYHDPSPQRLDEHLRYLASKYSLIDVGRLEAALASGAWDELPRNAILVTFDDGHAGNAQLAPVLIRHGVRPLIYVCPSVIEGAGHFWFKTPGVDPEPLKLVGSAERAAVIDAAGVHTATRLRDALKPDELKALAGVADIGSHTETHPILPLCTEEEVEREIVLSRERVSDLTNVLCRHFSYPNGDYTDREVELVRRAGYSTARTTEAGWNRPGCDPLRLRIASPADHCSVNALAADLAGLFQVRFRRREAARRRELSSRLGLRSEASARRARSSYDVAFYVPWLGPLLTDADAAPPGGAETQIHLLARALASRSARVRLLVFDLPDSPLPTSVDGVDVAVRPPYRSHERLGKVREVVALARAIFGANAGAVVTRSAGPHVGLAGLCAKLSRRRFVHSSANVSDFDFERIEPRRRNRALFKLGMRLADEIVVQTTEQVALCEQAFGRTPKRIGSIAEPARPRQHAPEAFLWVGRLVWYKRPLEYVDLARSVPNARFWMVGVPVGFAAESAELADEIRRCAADVPNLELLEPRPRPELMSLLERAVAMVNTAEFEGMPNIFLEGWGRGVPGLALHHDPDGVIERHGLGGFARGSTAFLGELAARLWETRFDQTELAARCRAYVDAHHSPEAVTSAWLEVLRVQGAHITKAR